MSVLLGGCEINGVPRWTTPTGILVPFSSGYAAARYHQLYAGRTLIGVTDNTLERYVLGNLRPSHYGQALQLVAVTPDDKHTDFGSYLPPRPYNRVKLAWTCAGYADCELFEITAGTVAGGAVSASNVIGRVLFRANGSYVFLTESLDGSGTWAFEVTPRDDTELDGNAGTALAISAVGVLAHPPDVALNSDGSRLTGVVAGAAITIDFAYNWSAP